jgi:TRAP-type C4-dicarboxylate transport system permease small subunit
MNITLKRRIYRMILVFLSTFILVVASFFMIYGLNLQKRELDIFTDNITLTSIKEKLRALSLFVAIVIIIINNILKGVVRYLTLYERHETVTA